MPKNFKDPSLKTTDSGWTWPKTYKNVGDFYQKRKIQLMQSRKRVHGIDLDGVFNSVQKNYLPHKVAVKKPRKIDNSQLNFFAKVNTALSIVLNTQFDATLEPAGKKYKKTTEFVRGLFLDSLNPRKTPSRQEYFTAAWNICAYGQGGLRTHRMYRNRSVYGPDNKTKEPKFDYDEVSCYAVHPRDYWIDDLARPGNRWSHTDGLERKLFSIRTFKKYFPEEDFPDAKFVSPGGDTSLHVSGDESKNSGDTTGDNMGNDKVETFFYENEEEDVYIIEANGVAINISPLPVKSKRLTLSHGIWALRGSDTANGIGLWEVMESDQQLIDMVRNMSIEQLVLSIFSMVFHSGAEKMTEQKLAVEAGRFYKFMEPEKIKQFQLNGPDQKIIAFIELFKKDQDDVTGVSKVLSSEQLGKTAFEANLNQEAGLRRLKSPANNLKELYEWESENRLSMIQQVYSMPRVRQLYAPEEIEAYVKEITDDKGTIDPEQFFVDDENKFFTKEYKEVPMDLKESEDGTFVPGKETEYYKAMPKLLDWQGKVKIKIENLLISSVALDKTNKLELAKLVTQYLTTMGQDPTTIPFLYPSLHKIILIYEEDPDDWISPSVSFQYKQMQDKAEAQKEQYEKFNSPEALKKAKEMKQQMPQQMPQAMSMGQSENPPMNPPSETTPTQPMSPIQQPEGGTPPEATQQ